MWHTREVDTELDLNAASRETLLEIIAGQRAVIADLQRRIGVLESRPNRRGSSGMPGNQPHSSRQAPEKKEPRKPRRHGFARQRMTPTRRVEHAVAVCPDCGTHLNGGWVQRTREVIELPVAPVEVTEHALVARICPVCQRRRLPKEALQGVVLGQQRLGVNLVSLMVTLREEGRLKTWKFPMRPAPGSWCCCALNRTRPARTGTREAGPPTCDGICWPAIQCTPD